MVLAPSFYFLKPSHWLMSIPTPDVSTYAAVFGLSVAALYWLVNLLNSHPFDNVRGPRSPSWLKGFDFDFQPSEAFG